MKHFRTLTTLGQARRLRVLALNALQRYDLKVARLSLITNDMNAIFRVDTVNREKWVLRVTVPDGGHNLEHVTGEMDWLAALAQDTSLSLPHPLPARDGSLVVEAVAPGVPEQRLCAIFSWVPGSDLADHLSVESVTALGRLLAILHEHART